jgi:hypothetical protein
LTTTSTTNFIANVGVAQPAIGAMTITSTPVKFTNTPTNEPITTTTPRPSSTPLLTKTPISESSMLYSEDFGNGEVKIWVVLVGDWSIDAEGENHYYQ